MNWEWPTLLAFPRADVHKIRVVYVKICLTNDEVRILIFLFHFWFHFIRICFQKKLFWNLKYLPFQLIYDQQWILRSLRHAVHLVVRQHTWRMLIVRVLIKIYGCFVEIKGRSSTLKRHQVKTKTDWDSHKFCKISTLSACTNCCETEIISIT